MLNCSGIYLKFFFFFQNYSYIWSVNVRFSGDGKEIEICGVRGF